jgi:hypothetical protein
MTDQSHHSSTSARDRIGIPNRVLPTQYYFPAIHYCTLMGKLAVWINNITTPTHWNSTHWNSAHSPESYVQIILDIQMLVLCTNHFGTEEVGIIPAHNLK